MGPIVDECKKAYAGKPVEFVKFDFTSDETTEAAEAKAKELGIEELYADKAGKTGFMLLYDPEAKEEVGRLTKKNNSDQCRAAIDEALRG